MDERLDPEESPKMSSRKQLLRYSADVVQNSGAGRVLVTCHLSFIYLFMFLFVNKEGFNVQSVSASFCLLSVTEQHVQSSRC